MKQFAARVAGSQYGILCRAFLAQFFASESVTSDPQLRKAMIGLFAFLITPALLIPFQVIWAFELAAVRFPPLLEPLTRLMATVFITYTMVAIGVLAAFAWDLLGFDRRDAMVLGPLPLRGSTVIAAKLTALAIVLLITAAGINLITGVPFAMVAGNHKAPIGVVRHFTAHMVATMAAAAFVFCALVTLRALLGMVSRGRLVASLMQFALVSALLCFIVFVPTAIQVQRTLRRRQPPVITVHQQAIPGWSPTNWFLRLYEDVRGAEPHAGGGGAAKAATFTLAAMCAAILTTIAGYRRQLRLALTPAASVGSVVGARVQCAIARWCTGGNRVAQATSDFIVTTLTRNRPQQAPIAINGAIGLAIAVAAVSRGTTDLASLARPRTALFWIPLLLTYWMAVGVRASFFIPSELPSAWIFRAHAPALGATYWSAVRAALIALLLPPALLLSALLIPVLGWPLVRWYAIVTASVVLLLAETIAITINFIPFTRAYPPGHAQLKTRWPLYLIGIFVFVYWPAHLASRAGGDPRTLLQIAAIVLGAAAVLEIVGRVRASRREIDLAEEEEESMGIAVLDIGLILPGASRT